MFIEGFYSTIKKVTPLQNRPVFIGTPCIYGAETWTMTKAMNAKIDAFDQWCQRRILRIHYTLHITNKEVRTRKGCTPPSDIIRSRWLRLFGHIARADAEQIHHQALCTIVRNPMNNWKRPRGHPS